MIRKVLLCMTWLLATACQSAKLETVSMSAPAPAAPAAPIASEPAHTSGQKPSERELREVIVRNYENAVTIDNSLSTPFLVGDFNGDRSEDIAIVVRPAGKKLDELNSEYVNWILEDPRQAAKIRPKINRDDLLLAVIHGIDREGWRNRMARQTYLLKNAVGNEFGTQSGRELNKTMPRLQGDVIREKLDGTAGIIFWTGGRYAWHPIT